MKIDKKYVFFLVCAYIIVIGLLIINNNTTTKVYDFTFSKAYILTIFAFLAIAIFIILFNIGAAKEKIFRLFACIIFAPMVFYPIFRCYFKIPYIFCHVCPRKCIFGHLRPYTIPAVLLLNLDKRAWCYKYCPIGKLQDKQLAIKTKKIVLPRFLYYVKYLFFAFVVLGYFMVRDKNSTFYNYFFKNIFSVSIIVISIAALLFILSFFVHRFWCDYICPIGTVSEDILLLERKWTQKNK